MARTTNYICRICGVRCSNQPIDEDHTGVTLCEQCYTLSGEQNSLFDHGKLNSEANARSAFLALEARQTRANRRSARGLFPEVHAVLYPSPDQHDAANPPLIAEPAPVKLAPVEYVVTLNAGTDHQVRTCYRNQDDAIACLTEHARAGHNVTFSVERA